MSNVTSIAAQQPSEHSHQGGVRLWNMLEAERWTFRKLEARTGIKKGVIASRMRGITPLTIEEVQVFAAVLGTDPVSLYAELINPTESPAQPTGPNNDHLIRWS